MTSEGTISAKENERRVQLAESKDCEIQRFAEKKRYVAYRV